MRCAVLLLFFPSLGESVKKGDLGEGGSKRVIVDSQIEETCIILHKKPHSRAPSFFHARPNPPFLTFDGPMYDEFVL